jgi:hypothetical protein
MKVSKAVELLSKHNPDDEIIIEWWARDIMEVHGEEGELSEIPLGVWNWVADGYEFSEYTYSEMFTQIQEAIYETIKENNNKGEK